MRANSGQRGEKIFAFIAGVLMTAVLVPALHAQLRLGGSRPAVLAPRRGAPVQSGNAAQGARRPAPSEPALNLTLVDPGPIGLQTTAATFPLSVPTAGIKIVTAGPANAGDPLKVGWARVDIPGNATNTIYFPQVVIGQGSTTVFTIVNTSSAPISGTLVLTAQDGTPLIASQTDASPTFSFPDDGIALAGSLSGVATFLLAQGGIISAVVGVLESPLVQFATIPVDNDTDTGRRIGFAVANPTSQAVTVKVALVDDSGTVVTDISPPELNPLGPGRQLAKFMDELFPSLRKFRGSMVLRAQGAGKIVPVALLQRNGLFSALPVIPEKAPKVPD
ncbi:MAG: hypothetical protein DMG08_20755 [Acidobacteria bacterium]|nr:MAG: hypothetical protein DMG08_20755 [Acidobacteriota bacterium]